MAVKKFTKSSIKTDVKYQSLLAGNSAYQPSSFESIATANPSAGTQNITFNSIPSTYKHLQIRSMVRGNWSGAGPYYATVSINFNSDTGANYSDHLLYGNGSSVSAAGYGGLSFIGRSNIVYPYGTTIPNIFGVAITDILDYSSTSKTKTIKSISGDNFNDTTGSGEEVINIASGAWYSTAAINSINIYVGGGGGSGVASGSTFALYGIKG